MDNNIITAETHPHAKLKDKYEREVGCIHSFNIVTKEAEILLPICKPNERMQSHFYMEGSGYKLVKVILSDVYVEYDEVRNEKTEII